MNTVFGEDFGFLDDHLPNLQRYNSIIVTHPYNEPLHSIFGDIDSRLI